MRQLIYIVGTNSKCTNGDINVAERMNIVVVNFDETLVTGLTFQSMQNVMGLQLRGMVADGAMPMNFKFSDAAIKGRNASLSRFAGHTPLVVVSKVKIKGLNETIGYNVSDCNGKISRVKKSVLIDYCRKANVSIPVQNMQWVCDKVGEEFLREYGNDKFAVEYINSIVPIIKSNKDVGAQHGAQFTKQQQDEIDNAINEGIDANIIANSKLSPAKMRIIWQAEKKGLPARKIADPQWGVDCMALLITEMEQGNNIDYLLNPEYNVTQLMELILGYGAGIDLSKIADSKLSANEMYERRIRMEHEIWDDEFISKIK